MSLVLERIITLISVCVDKKLLQNRVINTEGAWVKIKTDLFTYHVTVCYKSNFWELDSLTNTQSWIVIKKKKLSALIAILKEGVLACQVFGWGFQQGNNSTHFPPSLLIGPTWAYFSLDFYLNNTDTQVLEFCHDMRVLFIAKNVERIGIQQSILLIIISALIVNLSNFVTDWL